VKEAGAPADDHEEAGAAEDLALLTMALLLVPPLPQQRRRRRPRQRSHRHRPSWMVPRRRNLKKVMWTADRSSRRTSSERGEPAGVVADLAAGVEVGAIAPPALMQGWGPAEATAAAAGGDRPPIAVAHTEIRASENPEDHSVYQGC
jgi:hypothetical protein